jgi:hypothetical protein
MRAEVTKDERIAIYCEDYDLCKNCKNIQKCPLVQAISQEIVILHYSEIAINECGLYQADFRKGGAKRNP